MRTSARMLEQSKESGTINYPCVGERVGGNEAMPGLRLYSARVCISEIAPITFPNQNDAVPRCPTRVSYRRRNGRSRGKLRKLHLGVYLMNDRRKSASTGGERPSDNRSRQPARETSLCIIRSTDFSPEENKTKETHLTPGELTKNNRGG